MTEHTPLNPGGEGVRKVKPLAPEDRLADTLRTRAIANTMDDVHDIAVSEHLSPEKVEQARQIAGALEALYQETGVDYFNDPVARAMLAELISPESAQRIQQLHRLAEIDTLTGAANKTAFDRARATAERDEAIAFLVFDGDNFKQVNDMHGHLAGDEVIKLIAVSLTKTAQDLHLPERIFRWGGDEFVVLAPKDKADEFIAMAERHFLGGLPGLSKVIAVPVGLTGAYGNSFEEGDAAMYEAKQRRK